MKPINCDAFLCGYAHSGVHNSVRRHFQLRLTRHRFHRREIAMNAATSAELMRTAAVHAWQTLQRADVLAACLHVHVVRVVLALACAVLDAWSPSRDS